MIHLTPIEITGIYFALAVIVTLWAVLNTPPRGTEWFCVAIFFFVWPLCIAYIIGFILLEAYRDYRETRNARRNRTSNRE
jgi:hypothetical protein